MAPLQGGMPSLVSIPLVCQQLGASGGGSGCCQWDGTPDLRESVVLGPVNDWLGELFLRENRYSVAKPSRRSPC
jgi:hypothetical protein